MAITTLAKAKLILDEQDKDAQIEALIPLVEDDYLAIRNKPFDVDEDENTVYPPGAEITAIRMIGYHLETQGRGGVASESLGDHSITYESGGYPASILKRIKRYVSFA